MLCKSLVLLLLVAAVTADPEPRRRGRGRGKVILEKESDDEATLDAKEGSRDGRLFSLFNIVQFNNAACRSNSAISGGGTGSTNRNGTCFTNNECASRGGTASGSCAAGFGVCCVFFISATGGNINQNCTYVRNPAFPAADTAAAAIQYTVNKCANNICRLRLDFETFTIQGTGNTVEQNTAAGTAGGVCLDSFDITVTTGQRVPQICGQNTGQHLYVDIGQNPTDSATLAFAFAGTATNRMWEIKVSQIPCFNECSKDYLPPEGCLQYHTGITGRLTTFNFLDSMDNHLANQDYSICVRQEDGFCCIQYTPCADMQSFSLDTAIAMATADTLCTLDFVGIEGSSGSCLQGGTMIPIAGRYCGQFLNFAMMAAKNAPICDCTKPFQVDIFTDANNDAGDFVAAMMMGTKNMAISRGVCLTYMQIPCA